MKTRLLLPIALLACAASHAGASPLDQGEPAQRVYTFALQLGADGAVNAVAPHGFQADATSRELDAEIRNWIFEPAAAGAGSDTSTYLRVVTASSPGSAAGFEVVSATTGPAPRSLQEPDYPFTDQMRGREGTVVLELVVRADGTVGQARIHDRDSSISRAMSNAALAAARAWTFSPERVDGQAVEGRVLWPVCFLAQGSSVAGCQWSGPDDQRMSSKTVLVLDSSVRLVSPIALRGP